MALTFWANLSGISPAKRSRSGPNSVYVDRSRGDNVQGILGAIGPFWPKWGLGRVPRSPSFFCLVTLNHATFRELRNGRFSPNLVTERSSVSRRLIPKDISTIFTLGVICPQNLTSKLDQTGTSLRAGSGHGMHCREILSTPRCSHSKGQGVSEVWSIFCTTYGCGSTGRKSCPIFGFWPIFPTQNP